MGIFGLQISTSSECRLSYPVLRKLCYDYKTPCLITFSVHCTCVAKSLTCVVLFMTHFPCYLFVLLEKNIEEDSKSLDKNLTNKSWTSWPYFNTIFMRFLIIKLVFCVNQTWLLLTSQVKVVNKWHIQLINICFHAYSHSS